MNESRVAVMEDPNDGTRRHVFRRQHLVLLDGKEVYLAGDRPEALVFAQGLELGLKSN